MYFISIEYELEKKIKGLTVWFLFLNAKLRFLVKKKEKKENTLKQ